MVARGVVHVAFNRPLVGGERVPAGFEAADCKRESLNAGRAGRTPPLADLITNTRRSVAPIDRDGSVHRDI